MIVSPPFLFILADFGGRYRDSLTEKYTNCLSNFLCNGFNVPRFVHDVHDVHVVRASVLAFFYLNGHSLSIYSSRVPVYYVLKSLLLWHDGDHV